MTELATRFTPTNSAAKCPAEPWLWGFLLGDMSVFALFFGAFLWEFGNNPDEFRSDASTLLLPLGLLNTLVLVGSSYAVVRAVHSHRSGLVRTARAWLNVALCGAAVFALVKVVEYAAEAADGHGPTTSTFFMYYFVLTGLHLMHVAIGSGLLGVWRWSVRDHHQPVSRLWAESAAGYWHMVDLLWLVIFSFFYIGSYV